MKKNIKRIVNFGTDGSVEVDLNNPVIRFSKNPILSPKDVNKVWCNPEWQVKTVHNAGITTIGDRTLMLFRSHLRCGKSVMGIAKSEDGLENWKIEPAVALKPAVEDDVFAPDVNKSELIENESGGVEDARIVKIGDTYAITYSAYHGFIMDRVRVSLITTKDFINFIRYGPLHDIDMRNVVLFNEKFNDKYAGLFRHNDVTVSHTGGIFTEIKIGYTEDWKSDKWKIIDKPVIKTGGGPSPFQDKIGPGAPPIKTKKGWLSIFHGVRKTMDGNPYVLGVAIHDLYNPEKVKMSSIPVLFPSKADCKVKDYDYIHVPNVVFTCGAIRKEDGTILIYYGGCDTVMNVGITHEDILIALCELYPQDAVSGKMLYEI